jgi:5S rRNA maturation endonuclease (ribonuclease M5)
MKKLRFIKYLQLYSEKNLIVVEGKKDKEPLQELNIKNVYAIHEISRIDTSYFKEVLILTDRDRKGKKIYKYLYHYFTSEGLVINEKLREEFFKVFGVVRVEEIRKKLDFVRNYLWYEELTRVC